MSVRYHQRGGQRIVPDYVCQRARITQGMAPCQRLLGRDLDLAISRLLLEVVTPEMVAETLRVHNELRTQAGEAARLRSLQVQRAQYEADLAHRRYLRVDPDNRLVAEVLEAEWNAKLQALAAAAAVAEQQRQAEQAQVTAEEQAVMSQLVERFPDFWQAPQTSDQERKRLVRLVIEDVTIEKTDRIRAQVRFKGGATRTLCVPLPPPFAHSRLTSVATLAALDGLLDNYADTAVAEQLNIQGYRTFVGLPFTTNHVAALRRKHGLKSHYTRLREAGWRTATEVAAQFGVSEQTIWGWYHGEKIRGARYNDRGTCLFWPPVARPQRKRQQRS
jgi:hypothetical protein